ncbi:MAG: LysR family transcriptional regulator [Planctomycetota bacterium]
MQTRALEIFCDVARLRSFSKAAKIRGVTQSAASQAVQQLESGLGVKLIDRSTRPLSLTPAGEKYHAGLMGILSQLEQLQEEVVSTGKSLHGPLPIAAIYSVGLSYLPDALQAYAARFPDVEVRVSYGRNETVEQHVLQDRAELGLVSYPKSNQQLAAVPWQKEPIRLVCAQDHSLASRPEIDLKDLESMPLIGFDPGLDLRQMIDAELTRLGVRVDFRIDFDNTDSIVRAIQANRGIGFLPEAAVRRETASGSLRVVACSGLAMTRPLGIVFRRGRSLSPAAQELGSLLLGRPLEPRTGKPPGTDGVPKNTSVVA